KAQAIVEMLAPHHRGLEMRAIAAEDIDTAKADEDILINTTSLGLHDGDDLPCGLDGLKPDALVADIIMIPPVTPWMAEAEKKGLKTHAGKHMLDYQRDLIGSFIGAL
ncbi:MAG: shikimate dehydrogenase, partial [Alphaproteobacteria bacterium]|nr:shikimate dehydrogenase [Alphaproteobacteria bacterium]